MIDYFDCTEPAYEAYYYDSQREYEDQCIAKAQSGSSWLAPNERIFKPQKPERDYFMYLYRTFYNAWLDCGYKKAATAEEEERLNREFWKLAERVEYYKEIATKSS